MSVFVVEQPLIDGATGARKGTMRHWVASAGRARAEAAAGPGRTWREVPESEAPGNVVENLKRAAAEEQAAAT